MIPIAFWFFGALSVVAALLAVAARRPARALQALVGVMGSTTVMLFLLQANLLASEMLLVIAGAAAAVWALVVRPRRMGLGPPGRARLNITRLVAFFVVLWLASLLFWCLAHSPARPIPHPIETSTGAGFGFWMALVLGGSAAVSAWLVVTVRRQEQPEEER